MKKVFLLVLSALLGACSSPSTTVKNDDLIVSNDFESLAGWIPPSNSLNMEQAHSGKYSIKADPTQPYSMGYNTLLGNASTRRPHKLKLTCWAFLPSEKAAAHYQMQVIDPVSGEKVYEDGILMTDQVKTYKSWQEVNKDFTLPDNVTATHEIRIFLWIADSPEPVYVDDVQVSIVE